METRRRKGCVLVALLFASVTLLPVLFGTAVGLFVALTADGGDTLEPARKARILAEAIGEAMNSAAFAFLVMVPVAAAVGIWRWRKLRASARPDATDTSHS